MKPPHRELSLPEDRKYLVRGENHSQQLRELALTRMNQTKSTPVSTGSRRVNSIIKNGGIPF